MPHAHHVIVPHDPIDVGVTDKGAVDVVPRNHPSSRQPHGGGIPQVEPGRSGVSNQTGVIRVKQVGVGINFVGASQTGKEGRHVRSLLRVFRMMYKGVVVLVEIAAI